VRHGEDGLLAAPGDVAGLADALARIASGAVDARALGDNGWARQRRHFSDVSMAAGIASVYREVLNA
jgi:glycosyltransferase involved in cell wall biosynthesis